MVKFSHWNSCLITEMRNDRNGKRYPACAADDDSERWIPAFEQGASAYRSSAFDGAKRTPTDYEPRGLWAGHTADSDR